MLCLSKADVHSCYEICASFALDSPHSYWYVPKCLVSKMGNSIHFFFSYASVVKYGPWFTGLTI